MRYPILLLLIIITFSCQNQKSGKSKNDENRLYRNYNFSVIIEYLRPSWDSTYNNTYINLNFSVDSVNPLLNFKKKYLYTVHYKMQNDGTKETYIPYDTLSYKLSNHHLDSIYYLTSKLFNINPDNLTSDTLYKEYIYDGYIAEVKLIKDHMQYGLVLGSISNDSALVSFNNLLDYLDKIKNAP